MMEFMYNRVMTQGFFQFNNNIINEISDFGTSSFDLLFITGQKGSSKSETMEKVIPLLEENNLIFQHFCFKNTVIDDFLLNFYDALRSFSLSQKITLKKYATDDFKEKVSHYFKAINTDCIIIIENFEQVDENIEIIDFLSHLAGYENVKLIVISRNQEKNLFRFKKIKTKTIALEGISKENFKSKLVVLTNQQDEETKEKFYEITKGLELYLNMSIKCANTTDSTIKDLVDEFERKNILSKMDFEEFIVSKFVSFAPSTYKEFFKTLCTISHPVTKTFLKEYNLGDISLIDYLAKNFLISYFKDEIYVKDYFKQYITKTFSIQEKITYSQNLIKIYQHELSKSPKDRLLRLSREAIRKELEDIENSMPTINQTKTKNFSYLSSSNSLWQEETEAKPSKLAEKLNKIREKKGLLKEENKLSIFKKLSETVKFEKEEKKETDRMFIINLINSSRQFSKSYQYKQALEELLRALEADFNKEFHIEILSLIAKNYEYLNNYQNAKNSFQEALKYAYEQKDSRICELEFSIASANKNLYRIEVAKEQFLKIAQNENNTPNYRAKAYIELGEMEEANASIDLAISYYNSAVDLSIGKSKEITTKAYWRLAVLYDENRDIEQAIKFYQKNYTTSSELKENKYYSSSLTNLALIYSELGKLREASEYLKLALLFDNEINDLENMYFCQKELAKLYTQIDETSSVGYFKQALDTAQKLNDNFKVALVYFEVGEYFYDRQEDEKALKNFLNARWVLKNNEKDENVIRINSRINDIKMRLDDASFKLILDKYDNWKRN